MGSLKRLLVFSTKQGFKILTKKAICEFFFHKSEFFIFVYIKIKENKNNARIKMSSVSSTTTTQASNKLRSTAVYGQFFNGIFLWEAICF